MKNEKTFAQLTSDTFTIGERHYTAIGYEYTDDLFAFLLLRGNNIVRIDYGAYNFCDVIVWED